MVKKSEFSYGSFEKQTVVEINLKMFLKKIEPSECSSCNNSSIENQSINQSSWLFKNRCSVIFPAGREVKICSRLCCGSCAEIISEKNATWKVECPRTTNWIFSGIFYLMAELINSFTDRYLVYNIWRSLDNMTTAKFKNADRGRKWNKKINILYLKSSDLFLSVNLAANRFVLAGRCPTETGTLV